MHSSVHSYSLILTHSCSDPEELDDLMTNKRIGAYVGIDPTASSLHVGHMLPLMSLFWMYVHGFHTVSLLGGATAKVGDPTDRMTTREKVHSSVRTANMVAMHYQLKKLWINVEEYGRKYGYNWEWAWHRELVNNNAWMNKLTIMEVLQILGPGVRIGTMLSKET
jgi:tyrosyl-tRNA synthetase